MVLTPRQAYHGLTEPQQEQLNALENLVDTNLRLRYRTELEFQVNVPSSLRHIDKKVKEHFIIKYTQAGWRVELASFLLCRNYRIDLHRTGPI